MSQIYKALSSSAPLPPTIPTSFVTDVNSPAIPAANVLDVVGGFVSTNNINLIQTDGSSGGNILTVQLTNIAQGFIGTSDATPTTIITFPLGATPGTFKFNGNIEAYDTTDIAGAAFEYQAAVRSTGAAGVFIGGSVIYEDAFKEAATTSADINVILAGNNLLVQVIGIAGKNIDWRAILTYRFVG